MQILCSIKILINFDWVKLYNFKSYKTQSPYSTNSLQEVLQAAILLTKANL